MVNPPEKNPAAKPQPQQGPKPSGGEIPKSDWRKESEPHVPVVESEHGTGGGQNSTKE
jgi:hypothetical protein